METDRPDPKNQLPARIEAEYAKAEIWFHKQVRRHGTRATHDAALVRYVHRMFVVWADEIIESCHDPNWPVTELRESIERTLDLLIGQAFLSKHYYRDSVDRQIYWDGFRPAATDRVRISQDWRRIQAKLKELAERQMLGVDHDIPSTQEPRPESPKAPEKRDGIKEGPTLAFPKRASWLKARLRERSWNKHDVGRHNGPDHKTVQKVLDGRHVREDVLLKLADALSAAPGSLKLPSVKPSDIPED
jgi:hypothetical protein